MISSLNLEEIELILHLATFRKWKLEDAHGHSDDTAPKIAEQSPPND